MKNLSSKGYYNGKNLFIESAQAKNDNGYMHTSGNIPFDLNIGSSTFGKYFENDFLNLKTKAELSDLPFLSPYITELDSAEGNYEIMLNVKYNLGRFNVAAGYMFHEMPDDHMGMHMGMGSMHSSHENHNEPYIGIDYKIFKDKNLRIFFNSSESMKTLGLMMPIFNIGKKMHMNHNMDHSNHN